MMSLIKRLSGLNRASKRAIVMAYDACAMTFALWAAFSIRLDTFYWPSQVQTLLIAGVAIAGALVVFNLIGVYRVVIRYLDHATIIKLLAAAALAAGIWYTAAHLSGVRFLPRSVGLIYWLLLFGLMVLARQIMALIFQSGSGEGPSLQAGTNGGEAAKSKIIAIFGANDAGVSLERSLRGDRRYRVAFFIDDSPDYRGRTVASRKVYPSSRLDQLIARHEVEEIFLAKPEARRAKRLEVIDLLSQYPVQVKTVPSLAELAAGRFSVSDIRPIDVNDLLSRDPVPPKTELIREAVEGGSILVTGGGEGVRIVTAAGERFVPVDPVDVVDTIGAGDTFGGALLAWWTINGLGSGQTDDLDLLGAAVAAANTAAGIACTRRGAEPPRRAELSADWAG